ncbi:unnamed protein product [Penicillium salamii]|uniref:Cytochrome P450 n=1 Tax=Penicillium salamii TaxID=1612424 RepID=A0A9W4NBE2_9EURO|nr:unnamed protein product [Penicillium salamii]CAG8013131.1 unnamed protein product [Penicillium salamii]CAG8017597.1 unnamed protein product [Penicillium salamii]CAG8059902.1 unnamed protein product [Penicillium salamii]CAG8154116.1 unnamed protein product [Penicillium salamii]
MMILFFQNLSSFICDSAVCFAHLLLTVIWGIALRVRHHLNTSPRRKSYFVSQDPMICRQIVAGSFQHQQGRNIISPNESRAIPNHPHKIAFGIDNAFTRKTSSEVSLFVNSARAKLNLPDEDWLAISHFAIVTTTNWSTTKKYSNLTHDRDQKHDRLRGDFDSYINIAAMVQILTLRVVLLVMFDKPDQDQIRDISILTLAKSINRIWIAQKGTGNEQVPKFEDDTPLQEALFDIFGMRNIEPGENPLNLILPSFETMWRIVLRVVLKIGFVRRTEHPEWAKLLVSFAIEPTKRQFEQDNQSASASSRPSSRERVTRSSADTNTRAAPSAKHLVLESLRLYVPTRRVHRAYQWSKNLGPHAIISADIEGCHLRHDIWGDDANVFNPNRWFKLTKGQKDAFMPFGCVPFECPAKPNFGPRMIGLLAGTVLAVFGESSIDVGWSLVCEDKSVLEHLKSGNGLSLNRTAYGDLYLARAQAGHSKL